MKYLTILAFTTNSFFCLAQEGFLSTDSSYFIILNDKGKTLDRFDIGEKITVDLSNNTNIKGVIRAINLDSLRIDDRIVLFNEIAKIALIKKQRKNAIVGGAMAAVGFGTLFFLSESDGLDISLQTWGVLAGIGLGVGITGIIVMIPKRHKISKSNRIVVISP